MRAAERFSSPSGCEYTGRGPRPIAIVSGLAPDQARDHGEHPELVEFREADLYRTRVRRLSRHVSADKKEAREAALAFLSQPQEAGFVFSFASIAREPSRGLTTCLRSANPAASPTPS
jgi:hypothetical protein